MPTPEQLRSRLSKKLKELFQLDQPDLDFGFYRIMHAKAKQVQDFIDKDLLKIVEDAFGQVDEARKAELQAAYDKAVQTAKEFGAPIPEETEPVKKAKAALDAAKDTASSEGDIYDHLYRFFERYYDNGDFISRRYYTRETSGKAAPFAVPYNGEEVKLHWANADQYYIKTAEYFSNFTFNLHQAREIQALKGSMELGEDEKPLTVHFRIVEAAEGEHGNVKASEANKRYFIIHGEKPVEITENSELVVNFEYRPDPDKTGQENTWRNKRNTEAVETVLTKLEEIARSNSVIKDYLRLLKIPAPTESDKKRPLLAKYINQYTARNTMDYFIHKDLKGFLRRELGACRTGPKPLVRSVKDGQSVRLRTASLAAVR
jgi:adenine-specific DNA-methyltransferase